MIFAVILYFGLTHPPMLWGLRTQRKSLSFSLWIFRDLRDVSGDSLYPIDSPPNALGAKDAEEGAK